jgi:nicotinamide mononucleotide (NMN) deamidase PncC
MNHNQVELAGELFAMLKSSGHRIVFCESCTAGLASATLGRFPGVSSVLVGSLVVYSTQMKRDWLDINDELLTNPNIGPVSEEVTKLLVARSLERCQVSTIAAAITGHLGPQASIDQYQSANIASAPATSKPSLDGAVSEASSPIVDGTIFVAVGKRGGSIVCSRHELKSPSPKTSIDHQARYTRQCEATELLYRCIIRYLVNC